MYTCFIVSDLLLNLTERNKAILIDCFLPRIPADVIEGCLLNRGVSLGLAKYRLISVTFFMGGRRVFREASQRHLL